MVSVILIFLLTFCQTLQITFFPYILLRAYTNSRNISSPIFLTYTCIIPLILIHVLLCLLGNVYFMSINSVKYK